MLDQGLAKKTQAKGHLCKPSRDEDSRKSRALICKPSRDEDSRKPRALLCKPSRDTDSRKLRAFMQTGRIYMENRISSLYGMARENGRKKEKCEETDKKQKTDTNDMDRQRLINLARPSTSHFAPLPTVGQPTPPHATRPSPLPPPRQFAPHPPGLGGQTPHQTAVTTGARREWVRIQRASAMRVTRVATTSDSARATMGEQLNPPPSVDSLFRSRTYAEFITDEELQRAKAEVEECYRRRAWARRHTASRPAYDRGRVGGPSVAARGLRASWGIWEPRGQETERAR